jgi:hypothetical protein
VASAIAISKVGVRSGQPQEPPRAGKGAESLGKGTAEGAGNLVTLHPGKAGADLGKGAVGAAKIGKGSAKGIGRLGKKIVGKGNKNKKEPDVAD